MPEEPEGIPQNGPEQQEEKKGEEKASIASAEIADEKPQEEEEKISDETAKSDADVTIEEESADVGVQEEEPEDVKVSEEEPTVAEEHGKSSVDATDEESALAADEGKVSEGEAEEEGDGKNEGEGVEEYEKEEKVEAEEGETAMEEPIEAPGVSEETPAALHVLPETHMLLSTSSPRPSMGVDHLLFNTSALSDFSEQIQRLEREEACGILEQEEEERVSIPSEETAPEKDEAPPIDRQPYLELHANLLKQRPLLKMKNNFLQRKMAEYFKRRKMEHVLRESDRIGDADAKYSKKLDAFWELRNVNNLQREAVKHELYEMKETRNDQLDSAAKNFEQMLARERETGTGLIYTKTAKEIPGKFLERLLRNQRMKSKEIEEMRLAYIRIRDAVNEVQAKIKAMDRIGENHTLIDYEQLKMENQNHADKIEERDEELGRLRVKYSAAIQCLAHFREKSTNTDIEIEEMHEKFGEVELDRNSWREKVNSLKQERDALRTETLKLRETSGLLSKPKLLLDLQDTMATVEEGKRGLEEMKEQFAKNTVVLEALKKNVDEERGKFPPGDVDVKGRKKLARGRCRLRFSSSLERFNVTQLFEEPPNAKK